MPVLNAKSTIKNLQKKGFTKDESHHHYYEFWYNGKLISRTYTSHNGQDIDDYLISSMRKQCKMDRSFFIEFAKCTKSKDEYIQHLKDNKHI